MNYFRNAVLTLFLIVAVPFIAGSVGDAKEPNQVKCPVLSGSVNKKVYTDFEGKRIYFCCPPCIQEFKKNPEKYMKQFENEGVVLEDAPVAKKK
jgi:YHS domain-containing protein